jgi:hypothetical protein
MFIEERTLSHDSSRHHRRVGYESHPSTRTVGAGTDSQFDKSNPFFQQDTFIGSIGFKDFRHTTRTNTYRIWPMFQSMTSMFPTGIDAPNGCHDLTKNGYP